MRHTLSSVSQIAQTFSRSFIFKRVEISTRAIRLNLSHLIGASRESCTIELGRLQRAGLIAIDEHHDYVVRHPEHLQPGAFDRIRSALLAPRPRPTN